MPDEPLTMVETAALLILMAEARQTPNVVLTDEYGCGLKKPSREKLERLKLIEVEKGKGGRLFLTLADDGWVRCAAEVQTGTLPTRAGAAGGALYAVLRRLGRFLAGQRMNLVEFIQACDASTTAEPPAVTADVESRIASAYQQIAQRPGEWVGLADLRDRLTDIADTDIDAALRRLIRRPGVVLVPEANQKVLSRRDRAAEVVIGDQAKHLISMGES